MKHFLIAVSLFILFSSSVHAGVAIFSTSAPIWTFNTIATVGNLNIAGVFQTTGTGAVKTITVNWGDGTSNTYAGVIDQAYSKTYSSAGTYLVRVFASSPAVLTKYTMTTSTASVSFNIGQLPSGMTYMNLSGNNTVSGSIASLPSGMTYLFAVGSNTISGSIASMPSGMTYLYLGGSNTVSGSVASMPSGMTVLYIGGSNTISGSITSLPSGMTYVYLGGSNTVSGSITSLPSGITVLYIVGNNTISGSVASLPSGMIVLYVTGNNTLNSYTTRTWKANNMSEVILIPVSSGGLSQANVDQLLIDLAASGTWLAPKLVTLTGTNAAPSSASAAAIITLTGNGVTVSHN